MKKHYALLLLAGLFFFQLSQAQYRMRSRARMRPRPVRQEIYFKPVVSLSAGYGYPNLDKNQLLEFYQDYRGAINQTGPVHGALDVKFNPSTSIGLMVSYGKVTAPYYAYNTTTSLQPDFTGHLENWSLLLNLVKYMPGSAAVSPYLRTAIGVNIWNQNYTDASGNKVLSSPPEPSALAYQASLGLRVHFSKNTGLFAEAGYGKYIVSGGLFLKLNQ